MKNRQQRILVINPNSNESVTEGMARELRRFHFPEGPEIECVSLPEGPFGIESQADVEAVTLPLRKMVSERHEVDAFVIACYSDPGLHVSREASKKPVFGIQECGVLTAMSRGERFGVIALCFHPYELLNDRKDSLSQEGVAQLRALFRNVVTEFGAEFASLNECVGNGFP